MNLRWKKGDIYLMSDVITIGEAMIAFDPHNTGPMRFVNNFQKKVGGAELNVAIGCARLGIKAGWISRLGDDEFGRYIYNFARGEGIDVSGVSFVKGYPTSLNFKEILSDGEVQTFYYRDKSPILSMTPNELDEAQFEKAKILHITGIFPAINKENNMKIINKSINLAEKYKLKISFDPNIRLKMWSKEEARETLSQILPHVDILLTGDKEMEVIVGEKDPDKILEAIKPYNISFVGIKQGDKGAVGYSESRKLYVPPVKSKVVDTVGAGDGFNVGVLYGYLNNWDLEKTLLYANTIGSMVVGVQGDNEGLPFLEEVQAKLGEKEILDR